MSLRVSLTRLLDALDKAGDAYHLIISANGETVETSGVVSHDQLALITCNQDGIKTIWHWDHIVAVTVVEL